MVGRVLSADPLRAGVLGVVIVVVAGATACAGLVGADFDGLSVAPDASGLDGSTDGAMESSGDSCAGGQCDGPKPVCGEGPCILASGQRSPAGIAVDATSVYWADNGAGTIVKVPSDGGTPVTIASGQDGPQFIAVDATSVYWTDNGAGTIMKAPLGGGVPMTLASAAGPSSLAVDTQSVYWSDGVAGTIMKMPLDGGTPVTLASGGLTPAGIAVDAANVYWSDNMAESIAEVPLDGGTSVTLASGPNTFAESAVVVEAQLLYWTGLHSLIAVYVTGGTTGMLDPISYYSTPALIAADSTGVYYTEKDADFNEVIVKVSLDGTDPVMLVQEGGLAAIALDATSVYWTDAMNGTVMRVSK
jgi:sugar lactone lactonase YvrE